MFCLPKIGLCGIFFMGPPKLVSPDPTHIWVHPIYGDQFQVTSIRTGPISLTKAECVSRKLIFAFLCKCKLIFIRHFFSAFSSNISFQMKYDLNTHSHFGRNPTCSHIHLNPFGPPTQILDGACFDQIICIQVIPLWPYAPTPISSQTLLVHPHLVVAS